MLLGKENLDLKLCLMDSAQCFVWRETEYGFVGVIQGKPARFWKEGEEIHAESECSPSQLRHYLDLDRDYGCVAARYAHIPAARQAIELYPGLRVLNQDPWEALICFILSANNNVGRIRSLTQNISRELGKCFEEHGERIYALPTVEALASCAEDRLRALGVGYRAPYLIQTARRVAEGFPLWELKDMPYEAAHARLTELSGVGDKVADCVLLFGCGHSCAFPVDVWVERLLKSWFHLECKSRKAMTRAARELLGENAGLLQQFLFHAARMGDMQL